MNALKLFAMVLITISSLNAHMTRFQLDNESRHAIRVTVTDLNIANNRKQSVRGSRILANDILIAGSNNLAGAAQSLSIDLNDVNIPLHLTLQLDATGKRYDYLIMSTHIPSLVSLRWNGKKLDIKKVHGNIDANAVHKIKKK